MKPVQNALENLMVKQCYAKDAGGTTITRIPHCNKVITGARELMSTQAKRVNEKMQVYPAGPV